MTLIFTIQSQIKQAVIGLAVLAFSVSASAQEEVADTSEAVAEENTSAVDGEASAPDTPLAAPVEEAVKAAPAEVPPVKVPPAETQPVNAQSFEDVPAEAMPAKAPEEGKKPAGINVDIGLATLYNFRGINVFAESSQMDQNAAFSPSLTWSIFNTGLYLSYWGAYQLSGDNRTEKVDAAYGHEQDLILGYSLKLANDVVALNFGFTYYFYPFADKAAAGAENPSYIEPLAGISIATVLDLGLAISYFHGVQDVPSITAMRYAYFNLSAGKSFVFNDIFGMSLGVGLGIKAWIEDINYNRFDLHFDWAIPINLTDELYIKPAMHLAWTDLETVSTGTDDDPTTTDVDESTRTARAGDEYMVYASINIGANF